MTSLMVQYKCLEQKNLNEYNVASLQKLHQSLAENNLNDTDQRIIKHDDDVADSTCNTPGVCH